MSKHPHHELAEAWFRRVWVELDATAIDDMFEVEGEVKGLGESIRGPEGFKAFQAKFLELVRDVEVSVREHFHDGQGGNMVLCDLRAVSRQSGQPVSMAGSVRYRVRDSGKVREVEDTWDWVSFYEQLGLLPENTFMRALNGERVGQ